MNKVKSVYFNLRPGSRERMWDTVYQANKIVNAITPYIHRAHSVNLYKQYKNSIINLLKIKISKYLINYQKLDRTLANKADIVYMWGAFPKNTDKPFILEIDNPYCLTYYHRETFLKRKNKLMNLLNRAEKLVFMSKAAKEHTLYLLENKLNKDIHILYPYMDRNYIKFPTGKNKSKNTVNFLFVGLDFKAKGGYELLEAFSQVKYPYITLTVVSNVAEDVIRTYSKDKRIKFVKPVKRDYLFKYIYPNMDILVFPSFYESFGVVILEALSFGLGIIATNTYAVPEMVVNDANGVLLHHPFLKPLCVNNRKIVACVDDHLKSFYERFLSEDKFYYGLYKELKEAIEVAIDNHVLWRHNSLEIFEEKFSPDIWIKNFKKILEET